MLVRIIKDWDFPPTFFGQTPNHDGVWGDIQFTEEKVEVCDFLIVLQRPPYNISCNCPPGNAWLITQEPPVNYFKFLTRSFGSFDRVYSFFGEESDKVRRIQPVLPWHVLKDYNFLTELDISHLQAKRDTVAWITSNKTGFPGQTARMKFREFLVAADFNIQLFGRGFQPIHDKFDGLFPSKYALAVENFSTDHYWTEKIVDCFLSWSLPFYWGAPNIAEYFPEGSLIHIDINKPDAALHTMRESIANNEWERRLPAISEARQRVLNELQFFPYVSKLIKASAQLASNTTRTNRFIAANPFPARYRLINSIKYYSKRLTRGSQS